MFGRKSEEIATQRAEIARLRARHAEIAPYADTARQLAETAAQVADPNSPLSPEERQALTDEAKAGGLANEIAKQFDQLHDGAKLKTLTKLLGRDALVEMFAEQFRKLGSSRIKRAMGDMSLGQALEVFISLGGTEEAASVVQEHSQFLQPTLSAEELREYVANNHVLPTDKWKPWTKVEFGLTLNDQPDSKKALRKMQALVVPAKGRMALEILQDEHPGGVSRTLSYEMSEGKLIQLGSRIDSGKGFFEPRLREFGKVAYATLDETPLPMTLDARVVYVSQWDVRTRQQEVVLGKMPKANE